MISICRLCAKTKQSQELKTSINDPKYSIKQKLIDCCRWSLYEQNENLPESICIVCYDKLECCWKFIEQVEKAQSKFNEWISKNEEVLGMNWTDGELKDAAETALDLPNEKIQLADCFVHLKRLEEEVFYNKQLVTEQTSTEPKSIETQNECLNSNSEFGSEFGSLLLLEACETLKKDVAVADQTMDVAENDFIELDVESLMNLDLDDCFVGDVESTTCELSESKQQTIDLQIEHSNFKPLQPLYDFTEIWENGSHDSEYELNKKKKASQSINEAATEIKNDDFLLQFSPNDFNADGTINPEKIAELNVSNWSSFGFKCLKCDEIFDNSEKLRLHNNANHPGTSLKYVCPVCIPLQAFSYRKRRLFVHHVAKNHVAHLKYCCHKCQVFYWDTEQLQKHIKSAHPMQVQFECTDCGCMFGFLSHLAKHEITHLPSHSRKKYECYVCKRTYDRKGSLNFHMKRHFSSFRFCCDKCGKKFIQRKELSSHLMSHQTERPFSCEECKKAFTTKMKLQNHKVIHSKELPFVCSKCDKKFKTLSILRKHEKIHSDTKPFTCNVCRKTFRYRGALQSHHRIHTGVRPFACTECKYRAIEVGNVYKHMRKKHSISSPRDWMNNSKLQISQLPLQI